MKNWREGRRELKLGRRKNIKIRCLFTLPKVYLNLIHVERLNNVKKKNLFSYGSSTIIRQWWWWRKVQQHRGRSKIDRWRMCEEKFEFLNLMRDYIHQHISHQNHSSSEEKFIFLFFIFLSFESTREWRRNVWKKVVRGNWSDEKLLSLDTWD